MLIEGIADRIEGRDASGAAREYLARHRDTYRIDPGDLAVREVTSDGTAQSVRFQQNHRGVPVFGAHYLVHLEKTGTGTDRIVTGTNGRYFTGLTVSTTPSAGADLAVQRAQRGLDPQTRATVGVAVEGLTVLPSGTGTLAWRLRMQGTDSATGNPFIRQVFVDAHLGSVVLQYDLVNFAEGAVTTTGTTEHGTSVQIQAYERADARFEMRDRGRAMYPATGGEILTYDAQRATYHNFLGTLPAGTPLVSADAIPFTGTVSEIGAVNAHWGAGQVYEYYRARFGRDGLDGKGSSMISVVNVTNLGRPFVNAFWDGQKMVYGGSSATRHSFAADLDVVGHEMTHGVITNSADLVYRNQSGALNEALADYFGNAIDVEVTGTPMSDPAAGLLGEDLCKTVTPAACALRNLNDGRTTYADYLGVRTTTDGGGVHLNSTIFSGALWDIREKLDPALADRVVYKALTEYMTPLDGFTDGRNAVLCAARALGLSSAQLAVIVAAFDAHGITPGWERRLGVDSSTLLDDVRHTGAVVSAADGRYVTSQAPTGEGGATWIVAGRTEDGKPWRVSPSDDRTHDLPATDGRSVVWTGYKVENNQLVIDLYRRGIHGGPITSVLSLTGGDDILSPLVSGDTVAWIQSNGVETDVYVKAPDGTVVNLTPGAAVQGSWLSLHGDIVAFAQLSRVGGTFAYNPVIYHVGTGQRAVIPTAPGSVFIRTTAVTDDAVYWVHDSAIDGIAAIKRSDFTGTVVTDAVPEEGGPRFPSLSANRGYVVYSHTAAGATGNLALPKLHMVPATGGTPQRISCNRGDQGVFDLDEGRRVVWLDGTTGYTNLVTRARPAVVCP